MFKLVLTVAGLLFLATTYASAGQSGDYAGISSGIFFVEPGSVTDRNGATADLHYNAGIPVSLFLGRQYESGLRIDAELAYKYVTTKELQFSGHNNKLDSKVWSVGAMGNVYYNFYHGFADAPYSPYLGVGIGLANVHMTAGTDNRFTYWNDGSDTVFAYQGVAGFNVPIRKDILLDAAYRYLGTTDVRVDQVETKVNSHNILLGVRYFFR